ncbi:hypothetical protein jhhlp_000782 [Lomentospora prolificans]|uniref:Ketoreductase (KR) domain-containing protein n=1 Tax=Lomentospora prolificans TaxID=41688 RepID=A0A2N3NJH5_9PEZI|nr:hypothetical protein jhhlp_000782 [Lomentospora prolificans]
MTSHTEFGPNTTATEVAAVFKDQVKGKNVVVTGVSPGGIGASTALAIASQQPAILILASRNQSNLDAVAADIKQKSPSVPTNTVLLDLASIDSVKAAASHISSIVDRIDILINNAGATFQTRDAVTTPGGPVVDKQLFTNHVGTFLLTSLLLPKLSAAASQAAKGSVRVVNLSSLGHRLSPIRFSDYAFQKELYDVPESERPPAVIPEAFRKVTGDYPGFVGYGQSKTANILHAWELTKRAQAKGENIFSVSVHPGTIVTGLTRSLDTEGRAAMDGTAPNGIPKTLDEGAATTLVAAFDPKLAEGDTTSEPTFLSDCQLALEKMGPHARDAAAAQRLWNESEKMVGVKCL